MNNTLVIHPADRTTDFLEEIYVHMPEARVIRGDVSEGFLTREIEQADQVYMLGHGTPQGLIGFARLMVNEVHVGLLKQKGENLVSVWCNADCFVTKHGLGGFYTGMIVSEPMEAKIFITDEVKDQDIAWSNRKFSQAVREALEVFPPEYAAEQARDSYLFNGKTNPVIRYNVDNIHSTKTVSQMIDDPRFDYSESVQVQGLKHWLGGDQNE